MGSIGEEDGKQRKGVEEIADEYYRAKEYREALKYYDEALQYNPKKSSLLVSKGNCLRKREQYNEALKVYNEAILYDSQCAKAYNGRGLVLKAQKKWAQALTDFDTAIKSADKKYSGCYLNKVDSLIEVQRYKDALDLCEYIIHNFPEAIGKVYTQKGNIYFKKAEYESALTYFDEAIEIVTDRICRQKIHYNRGIAFYQMNWYDEALEAYAEVIQIDPEHTLCWKQIALLPRENRLKKSEQYWNKGKLCLEEARYETALTLFDLALRFNNKYPPAYIDKGNIFLILKRYETAVEVFATSIQLLEAFVEPARLEEVYAGKGHAHFGLGHLSEARQAYQNAITMGVQDVIVYRNLADILAQSSLKEAMNYYNLSLQIHSEQPAIHIKRGDIFYQQAIYEQALIAYQQSLAMDDTNAYAHLRLGDCLMLRQREKEAISFYEIALKLIENDLNSHAWLHQQALEYVSYRPASVQFELLSCLLNKTRDFAASVFTNAYKIIGKLYDSLLNADLLPADTVTLYVQKLASLLQGLSIQGTTTALYAVVNDDLTRLAHLVLLLAPHTPHNIVTCVHDLLYKGFDVNKNTDLALKLYQLLFAYDFLWQEREMFHVRILMAQNHYDEAELLLSQLAQTTNPEPDVFLFLDEILQHNGHPLEQRVAVLQRVLVLVQAGEKAQEAALRIGDIYSRWEGKSIEAINAYQEAEKLGAQVKALNDFRCGNWDTEHIPVLRTHPNYAFPVVVVLDLECDYKPDAKSGSRVFEVGAVRMKGNTELEQFHAIIRRDFIDPKVANRQAEAQNPEDVVETLKNFIGEAVVVGHNLRDFDEPQLRGMELQLNKEQILDTLVFARLLYPDSIYHNLQILCEHLGINTDNEWHQALADARACAVLFHELGEELVRRGDVLIAGFRAFTLQNSAFDRAVLRPRKIAADPMVEWKFDPFPMPVHALTRLEKQPASHNMIKALQSKTDILVEHYDPNGTYIQALPSHQRNVVTVGSRSRLERMIAPLQTSQALFVLPHPQILLCPQKMRQYIEKENNAEEKLQLFCLYQASHNHDASTLYSLRLRLDDLPNNKQSALQRRCTLLLNACCGDDHNHATSCPAFVAAQQAIATSPLLIATHKDLLAWRTYTTLNADLIVIDNAEELQMHFAEYLAEYIDGASFSRQPLNQLEIGALQRLERAIDECARRYVSRSGTHERLSLQLLVPALTSVGQYGEKPILSLLEDAGPIGRRYASQLKQWCDEATREISFDNVLRACWIDLKMSAKQEIERWSVGRICLNVQGAFQHYLGKPYTHHIICGTAVTLGTRGTTFLSHYFGLREDLTVLQDVRPEVELFIPDQSVIGFASFLRRRSWAIEVGCFLCQWVLTHRDQSMMVTLHEAPIAHALIDTLKEHISTNSPDFTHQLLSPRLNWSLSKIAERVENPERHTLTILAPTTRRTNMTVPVAVEATGPLRFLNRRDPLVIAHMHIFKDYNEGPFHEYLLPQALLELKTRLASPAHMHIILDGALRSRIYYDEVCSLVQSLQSNKTSRALLQIEQEKVAQFQKTFEYYLKKAGFDDNVHVTDEDLNLTLQSLWHINAFKHYQRENGTTISQKEIINTVFADKESDQLVVIATGGGKSLCFQLPAVLLAEDVVPRVTLVFSPLIALMRDQVQKLHQRGLFSAVVLNSELSSSERAGYLRGIKNGDYSIVYMAPEQIRSIDVLEALREREIGLIAIDEAHCVSQWGHDFRTDYFALKQWIEKALCRGKKRKFPLIALTATARQIPSVNVKGLTSEVSTVQDIIDRLGLRITTQQAIITSPERLELVFQVEKIDLICPSCSNILRCIGNEVFCPFCDYVDEFEAKTRRLWQTKYTKIVELLYDEMHGLRKRWDRAGKQYQRGIIYCRTRATTEQLTNEIVDKIPALRGKIAAYHAGMFSEDLNDVYTRFINDDGERGLRIVVATSAFGMGVDAERLGFVIHFDVPATPEAYYQEAGRAGRNFKNGETAQCILLYHDIDLASQRWMTSQNKITEQDIVNVYDTLFALQEQKQGSQELLVTEDEIASRICIESSQIDTLLYYLEYHATIRNKPIIQRAENVSHI